MATLASVVNFKLPNNAAEDSFDLLPLWTGKSKTSSRTSLVHNTHEGKYAIRAHGWTLIATNSGNHNGGLERFNYQQWQKKHGYSDETGKTKWQLSDMKKRCKSAR